MAIFERYPTASWRVGDDAPIFFPVEDISEEGGNRIVEHERPFRNGAKLDDTGSKARRWTFAVHFNNTFDEGVQNGVPLYPNTLRRMLRSFDQHETGNLCLPTVGIVRARASSYKRVETTAERDTATVELTFVEDNEDALDRAALNPPGVVATLVKLSEQTVFSAQKQGLWNEDMLSLTEFASEIEGLLLAPGRATADLGAVVRSHRNAIQRIIDAGTTVAMDVGGLFAEPRGSETQRQLRTMLDREARAEDERTSSRPRTKSFVVDVEQTSIYEISARLNQDVEELMELNASRIEDPFYLTRGEVLRVYESQPR